MPGYGEIDTYGYGAYKQDLAVSNIVHNKINSYTGLCLGYAVKEDQGQGYWFIKNATSPTAVVYPDPYSEPLAVLDSKDQVRYIVLDETTGHWYELGTRDGPKYSGLEACYLDKEDQYGGTEIPCRLLLAEHKADVEHKRVEHVESHFYIRPQRKTNKGDSAYTSYGLRPAWEADLLLFKDGDLAESARTKSVPMNGDLVTDRFVKANRIQVGFYTTASEFRLAETDQYYLACDEAAVEKAMTEHGYQDEFNDTVLWLTRGSSPALNRADGTTLSGTYFGTTDGPDGKDNSALSFSPVDGLTCSYTLGDFTLMGWVRNLATPCEVLNILKFDVDGDLVVDLNTTHADYAFGSVGTNWTFFTVTRSGQNVSFYRDGVLLGTRLSTDTDDVTISSVMYAQEGDLAFLRVLNTAISAGAVLYAYQDVDENEANALEPIW